ncbi:FabD/lysophospholipase-like protein [Acephala macrosclerotiorum]|nr:FabD/lysophospholipase-like protein [Acephala macrosclerotiorum]
MESPVKETRKLLSLDGGGVRGMSAIAILRELMEKLADKRRVEVIHPWQEFDMIGGTSTGGLLAIMLGRLRMSIDQCEDAYMKFSEDIFTSPNAIAKAYNLLNATGRFSTQALETNIKEFIDSAGLAQSEKFDDSRDGSCKVFVSVVRQEDGANTVLRSYVNPEMPNPMRRYCKIWEAARATSAASTFFEPIAIGPNGQTYVDGALGFNNPIRLLDRESRDLWPDDDRVFLSIGTGSAPGGSLEGNLLTLATRLNEILVETEKTAEGFLKDNQALAAAHRYYRFNVYHGLGHIGLEEYKARQQIYAATATYLETMDAVTKVKQFVSALSPQTSTPVSRVGVSSSSSYAMAGTPQDSCINFPKPAAVSFAQQLQARKKQADLNKKLLQAVNRNDHARVETLLNEGADANAPGPLEASGIYGKELHPIYIAAFQKHNEILQLLLQRGAKVDAIGDNECGTALQAAIRSDNEEGMEVLLMAGANPNAKGSRGNGSPLQEAAKRGHINLLETLILAGADVNENSGNGTALDAAAPQQNRQMIRILIDAGADMDAVRDHSRLLIQRVMVSH